MNETPDLIDRCLAVVAEIAGLTAAQRMAADRQMRKEMGGRDDLYIRKRSPLLREAIRARYDGTMATTRALAVEFEVSETTVRRIGLRTRQISAAAAPRVTPKLAGRGKK